MTIPAFDVFLAERQLSLRATVIGGAALQLLGVIARPTQDCDVLDPELPAAVLEAAAQFAAVHALSPKWLNNGPRSLTRVLPPDWPQRVHPLYRGRAVQLFTLGREDLLRSKLFALVDRNIDLPDCVALAPTASELSTLLPWLIEQDGNPEWPGYVQQILADLERALGRAPELDRGL